VVVVVGLVVSVGLVVVFLHFQLAGQTLLGVGLAGFAGAV